MFCTGSIQNFLAVSNDFFFLQWLLFYNDFNILYVKRLKIENRIESSLLFFFSAIHQDCKVVPHDYTFLTLVSLSLERKTQLESNTVYNEGMENYVNSFLPLSPANAKYINTSRSDRYKTSRTDLCTTQCGFIFRSSHMAKRFWQISLQLKKSKYIYMCVYCLCLITSRGEKCCHHAKAIVQWLNLFVYFPYFPFSFFYIGHLFVNILWNHYFYNIWDFETFVCKIYNCNLKSCKSG